MSGSLIDANVLLDIATTDAVWMTWSKAARRGVIDINPIIYAELAPAFATKEELDSWLDPRLFQRAPLPDFYIGAQAEIDRLTLVSRDAARYRTYFPSAELITP